MHLGDEASRNRNSGEALAQVFGNLASPQPLQADFFELLQLAELRDKVTQIIPAALPRLRAARRDNQRSRAFGTARQMGE